MSAFVIDREEVEKLGYTLAEFFYFLSIVQDPTRQDYYKSLADKGAIIHTTTEESTLVQPIGKQHLQQILYNSRYKLENTPKNVESLDELATELIALFPKGMKPGTNQQWRGSQAVIASRLKALVTKRKVQINSEEAIQATKNYISSFNGNYSYMQTLKYFIFKNKSTSEGVEFDSQLLNFIENLDGDYTSNNSDWTAELI